MIGYYNYTVIATYLSLLSSCVGIFMAIDGHPFVAIMCLMLSGLLDMFDGTIALTKKDRTRSQKRFGIQIDSMCDLICFGVLPCVIGISVGLNNIFCLLIMFCYLLCALIRLSFFNVDEEERQEQTEDKRKYYLGLPVTMAAIFFPCVYILKNFSIDVFRYVYITVLALVAVAFVSPIKIKKLGQKGLWGMIAIGFFIFAILLAVAYVYGKHHC